LKFPVGLETIAVLSDDDLPSPLVKLGDSLYEFVTALELNFPVYELRACELTLSGAARLNRPPSKPILPRVSDDTNDDSPTDFRFY